MAAACQIATMLTVWKTQMPSAIPTILRIRLEIASRTLCTTPAPISRSRRLLSQLPGTATSTPITRIVDCQTATTMFGSPAIQGSYSDHWRQGTLHTVTRTQRPRAHLQLLEALPRSHRHSHQLLSMLQDLRASGIPI